MPEAEVRVPCPMCGEGILRGARKCPHCREILDPGMVQEQQAAATDAVHMAMDEREIRRAAGGTAISAGIGSVILAPLGPLFGPLTLAYGLWYQHRSRRAGIAPPPAVRLVFGLGGLWFATGAIFWVVIVWIAGRS